jgi:ATP-binding cassette subfamily B (MDR/TAP) protein 1
MKYNSENQVLVLIFIKMTEKAIGHICLSYIHTITLLTVLMHAEVSCWMVTGERQAARIRGLYLETILKQDISFFDMETSTGEVIERMSSDTVLIQDAIGEKVRHVLSM